MTDNLIQQLAARERAEQTDALTDYYELLATIAEGGNVLADDTTASIVTKAGKTSKDMEADLAMFKRRAALVSEVAELDEAQAHHRAAREEGQAMRLRHEEQKRQMKAEEDELKARDFALTTHVQDLRRAARDLEEVNAEIEQARAGTEPSPTSSGPKRRTPRQLLPTTKPRPDGWSPPSPYDYDTVESYHGGKRAFFYRHRKTGKVVYPPTHPKYAG